MVDMYFTGLFFTFFFSFLLIYGGLGFWRWGLELGFWGFQLMGFWGCGVRPSEGFGVVGALYINI